MSEQPLTAEQADTVEIMIKANMAKIKRRMDANREDTELLDDLHRQIKAVQRRMSDRQDEIVDLSIANRELREAVEGARR